MRVLALGGTGNLGSRITPALLSRGHDVVVYIRSPEKLHSMISPELAAQITIVKGDALDSDAIARSLLEHECDAIVNASGNQEWPWKEQVLGRINASVSSAAIKAGKKRGKPLRAWVIGGLNSLMYPGTGYQIQDYLPARLSEHHHGTERVMKAISLDDLEWSVLCVALMFPESKATGLMKPWAEKRPNNLLVGAKEPPGWTDHWVKSIPVIGIYLNLVPSVMGHNALYEDVANLIADDLEKGKSDYVGAFVGCKVKPTASKED